MLAVLDRLTEAAMRDPQALAARVAEAVAAGGEPPSGITLLACLAMRAP
jgi:hypothetical protein